MRIIPMTEELREKLVKIAKLKSMAESMKKIYNDIDKVTLELYEACGTGEIEVVLKPAETSFVFNGEEKHIAPVQVVTITDNFESTNTVFKNAAVKRYEAAVQGKI
jgi:hypothetical protein